MVELSDRRSAISDGLVERICAALGFLECVRGLLEQHVLLFDRFIYEKKDFLAINFRTLLFDEVGRRAFVGGSETPF